MRIIIPEIPVKKSTEKMQCTPSVLVAVIITSLDMLYHCIWLDKIHHKNKEARSICVRAYKEAYIISLFCRALLWSERNGLKEFGLK